MKLYVNITKKLEDFTLNVEFETGKQTLGLLGESGSGKSMTLKCIAGLIKPDKGKIILNDRILFDSEKKINVPIRDRRVGYLFQNYALFPHMTVEENVGYGLNSYSKVERKKIVDEKLQLMQISELRNRYPHQISGGQQQRAALARSLAVNPEVLLLDEPFSALDNHLRSVLVKHMTHTLGEYGGYTLFVTHNMEEAYALCKNIMILSDGCIESYGDKSYIFNSPNTVTAARLTGCKNISSAKVVSNSAIFIYNWNCLLHLTDKIGKGISHVGIRAHYLEFTEEDGINVFTSWPSFISEAPFRRIVYLKLHREPVGSFDYDLLWDISIEEWIILKEKSHPWKIRLNPERLILIGN